MLEETHRRIDLCFEDLEAITSEGPPEAVQLSAIRMRIGQAILIRRQVARDVYGYLLAVVCATDAAALRDLQRRDLDQFRVTSGVIQRWTPQRLRQDWPGYCDASRNVRDGLREIMDSEKRFLCPLLDRLG
jgi:hypothetical protein